jgi:hypothetical protein
MNKVEYLLICLMEEAAEIQQAAAKALRFGLDNHHPDRMETNAQELQKELTDLDATRSMLISENALPSGYHFITPKIKKVERYMQISEEFGILQRQDAGEGEKE